MTENDEDDLDYIFTAEKPSNLLLLIQEHYKKFGSGRSDTNYFFETGDINLLEKKKENE